MGLIFAFIVWLFLIVMTYGVSIVWHFIPNIFTFKIYPLIICLIGGVILGLIKIKYGESLDLMGDLFKKIKNKEKLHSENIILMSVSALVPMIFGGSIGPEAGLCCVIVVLCMWISKYMTFFNKNIYGFYDIGINSVFTLIFLAPIYGLVTPVTSETNTKKKLFSNIVCLVGAVILFYFLLTYVGGIAGLPRVESYNISNFERIWGIPLIFIGSMLGILYLIFEKYCGIFFDKFKSKYNILISCILGGLLLGIIGTFFPLTLFSGEENMRIILETYLMYSPVFLIGIGIIKLFLTHFCIKSGWIGGPFFPTIFCGISIGCGLSMILGLDIAFTVSIVTAALLGVSLKKPLIVVLILLLCFNIRIIPWLIIAALISYLIPTDWINSENRDIANS